MVHLRRVRGRFAARVELLIVETATKFTRHTANQARRHTMQTEEIVLRLEPWRVKQRRPAWKPVVEAGEGPATASKFCGTAWTEPDAPWPDCGHCRQPLRAFLQLDLTDLPAELGQPFGTGLLQLFYCTRADCYGGDGHVPFADTLSRVRVVPQSVRDEEPDKPVAPAFPAKRVVGWSRFSDLPSIAEHEALGLDSTFDHSTGHYRVECPEFGLSLASDESGWGWLAEGVATAAEGDKLGGWPAWVQDAGHPSCPRCDRRMVFVFQVDSEHNVPFMFGDAGCGHITQCPEHKEVVAFAWACH